MIIRKNYLRDNSVIFFFSTNKKKSLRPRCWIKIKIKCKSLKFLICSIIKILHDLSSNRCKPGWFLSLMSNNILVRKDQILEIILVNLNIINVII